MKKRNWGKVWRLGGMAGVLALSMTLSLAEAQTIETGTALPDSDAVRAVPPVELTRAQMEKIFEIKETKREEFAKRSNVNPPGSETTIAMPLLAPPPTEEDTGDATRYPGVSSALLIGRNNKNTNGNNPAKASTLAETTAVNEGINVYSAGNFNHAERSSNGGATWTDIPLPGGPADAPILCCDSEWVYDKARGVSIMSTLYINAGVTNGVIRFFVFRNSSGVAACSYTIDEAGAANNVLMDYPHIGLSRKYLYLSTNDIGGGQTSRMRRYDLDSIASCAATAFTTFSLPSATYGQRVFRPAQGGVFDTQYWAIKQTTTLLRIFSWPESAAAPTSTTRVIAATGNANAVCRGGTNGTDYFDALATSLAGFDMNGAVGGGRVNFTWSSSPVGTLPQAHSRGAYFSLPGLALIAQPILWNPNFCIGLTTVTANEAGDRGLSLAYGGNAAGTGGAARGAVAISDDYSPGIGLVGTFSVTSGGTHNRVDGRYGDYFSARRHEPCSLWFTATNYGLVGGTTSANVDSRYVEFGRGRNEKCYTRFRSLSGTP